MFRPAILNSESCPKSSLLMKLVQVASDVVTESFSFFLPICPVLAMICMHESLISAISSYCILIFEMDKIQTASPDSIMDEMELSITSGICHVCGDSGANFHYNGYACQ